MPQPSIRSGPAATFGHGAASPYDHALHDPSRTLHLHEFDATGEREVEAVRMEVERFSGIADTVDVNVLGRARGSVIDIGCGPGRLVRAAIVLGHLTLGIDVSAAAVHLAQQVGLPVLRRSVFQDLPAEGSWGTALLIDGNIGIGGDPQALLERCASLVDKEVGRVIIETHPDPTYDRMFDGILIDDLERQSLPFPWAEIGGLTLRSYAARAQLRLASEWTMGGRSFAEYSTC